MRIGCEHSAGLEEKLALGRPLTFKLGFDPTSPDLHLGHYIVLRAAKRLQDMGHAVHIIVGDFTAAIGDPSGRNKLRPALSQEAIDANAQTYMDQVFMVLDPEKTSVSRNSLWLGKLGFAEILRLLSSATVSQMLARDDFKKRFDAQSPIFLHEMAYPLMQALDSVQIRADAELGGTDQTFNLLMGRELQKSRGQEPQAVLTFPLLVGLDGEKKMSKSLNNHIALLDPPSEKFGKIMSVSDHTLWKYLDLLLEMPAGDIQALRESGKNPRDIKLDLAEKTTALFHGPEEACAARAQFIERFSKKGLPDAPLVEISIDEPSISLAHLVKFVELAVSVSDANRKIEQRGVKLDSAVVTDRNRQIPKGSEVLLQVGKLHCKKVRIR